MMHACHTQLIFFDSDIFLIALCVAICLTNIFDVDIHIYPIILIFFFEIQKIFRVIFYYDKIEQRATEEIHHCVYYKYCAL